jgi:hypothetical protein
MLPVVFALALLLLHLSQNRKAYVRFEVLTAVIRGYNAMKYIEILLRRIFGPKRDEVTGAWRKLHNEELHNLYSSPSIITIIKSKRMRWAGHLARMGV